MVPNKNINLIFILTLFSAGLYEIVLCKMALVISAFVKAFSVRI